MGMFRATLVVVAAVWLTPLSDAVAEGTPDTEAAWRVELHEMGYLLFHLSSINAIQGLNLDREQVRELRRLALEMERVSTPPPDFRAALSSEAEEVRAAYLALSQTLLDREPITPASRRRVGQARKTEAALIRGGLHCATGDAVRGADCGSCHRPSDPDVEPDPIDLARLNQEPKRTFLAHTLMAYGRAGTRELARVDAQAEAILTPGQFDILSDFSCCLIPPDEADGSGSIGQAEAPSWAATLLERCRATSEARWPRFRERTIERLVELERVKRPDLREDEIEALGERASAVFEKARGLSELDFVVRQRELSAQLAPKPATAATPRGERFMAAFFLLLPGTVQVYDDLLAREPLR